MNLRFEFGGVAHSANSILEFTRAELPDFWREPFFHFYPEIDRERYNRMDNEARHQFLMTYFTDFAEKHQSQIADRIDAYQAHWQRYRQQITQALEDTFSIDLSPLFNDLVCRTGFNPICPRYLEQNAFDNFYLESEKGALGTAMHEIIHFVWFYVWQQHFRDDPAEYETPHLKWILSEMVVEPVMRDERLGAINPYYLGKSCVYPYFYTMQIDGAPILDTLFAMLSAMPMPQFLEASYRYCLTHEAQIRKHIEASETGL